MRMLRLESKLYQMRKQNKKSRTNNEEKEDAQESEGTIYKSIRGVEIIERLEAESTVDFREMIVSDVGLFFRSDTRPCLSQHHLCNDDSKAASTSSFYSITLCTAGCALDIRPESCMANLLTMRNITRQRQRACLDSADKPPLSTPSTP